jgi:uncharacterized protein (TIGR04255 family)
MALGQIPSFKNPPVFETVLGFAFAPLEKWSIPHFGLFWEKVRHELPNFQVHAPLAAPNSSNIRQSIGPLRIEVVTSPEVRCWFVSNDDSELIQIQSNRFLVNWRSTEKNLPYPRYNGRLRPLFHDYWMAFRSFLEAEQMGEPSVVQCELTYVNHINKGEGWEAAADWHKVFTVCQDLRGREFLPEPDSRQFSFNYQMPGDDGSLNVKASRAVRLHDSQEVIRLDLTAKGRPASTNDSELFEWLDRAHDWIVRGFAELTTIEMHKRWEREI